MKFSIDQKIFEKFSGLTVGAVVVRGVNNAGEKAEVMNLLREEEQTVRERVKREELGTHPKVVAWREAYRAFGAKPKEHLSSVENLYRRVLDGVDLRHINTLVDVYNYISLKYMLPVGGEDLEKVQGDIRLAFAGSNEPPVLLLGDKELKTPKEGEVIYRDDAGAVCRRFNWREADRTKLTEETTQAVLVIEGLPPTTKSEVEKALSELENFVQRYCGGESAVYILDQGNHEIPYEQTLKRTQGAWGLETKEDKIHDARKQKIELNASRKRRYT
jgi:DNA/RNA-binding domain of Phe-tRNA-synthetase-like protein